MILKISNPTKATLAQIGSLLSSLVKGTCKHAASVSLYERTTTPLLVLDKTEYKIYTATGKPCVRIKNSYLGDHALYLPMSVAKVSEITGKYLCLYSEDKYLKATFGSTIPDILRTIGKTEQQDVYASCLVDKPSHRVFFHQLNLFRRIQSNFIKSMPTGESIRNSKHSFTTFAQMAGEMFRTYTPKPKIPLTSFLFLYEEILRDPNGWSESTSKFPMACRLELGKREGKFIPVAIISRTLKFSVDCIAPFPIESQANILLTVCYESGKCKLTAERYVQSDNEDKIRILKDHV